MNPSISCSGDDDVSKKQTYLIAVIYIDQIKV